MPTLFEVYRDGKRLTDFSPVAAMAMGPESVPVPGDIAFRDGLLVMSRSDDYPAAISLLWDVGALGVYVLETTRLQPREKPYNLNVELARFRLMKIVQKKEDWNLFDFPKGEKFEEKFKAAQALLSDALGAMENGAEASRLADQSLAQSIELSEELAMFHGELLLHRRRASNALSKHLFGCRVDSTIQNQKYKDLVADNFDYAVLPMSWKQLQTEQDVFDTASVDDWVEMLAKKRVPVVAGPLIDLNHDAAPDWMFMYEYDYDTLRELAYEYVQKVVARYRKTVGVWNVVAGLQTNGAFSLTFEQAIELTRLLVSAVKSLLPQARTLVTISHPYGEYNARGHSSVPPMLYAEMVSQSGINFDAFAIEIETGVPATGLYTRDLFQISSMLDRFSAIGRPVFVTSMCAPGRSTGDPNDRYEGKLDPSLGGRWHREWDPQLQMEWMDAVCHLALSKPFVECIAWGNLADINPTVPAGGLVDDMFKPKPAFTRIQDLRDQFHKRK